MSSVRKVMTCKTNARGSTGPRSEAGKSLSAENARVHGLRARQGLLPWENAEEYDAKRARLWEELAPVGMHEELLAESVLRITWQLECRLPVFEVRVISRHVLRTQHTRTQDEAAFGVLPMSIGAESDACPQQLYVTQFGAALIEDLKESSTLVSLDRYRRSLERSRATALDRLQLCRQQRREASTGKEMCL